MERVGIAEGQGFEVLGGDAEDGKIEPGVACVDFGDLVHGAIAGLDAEPASVADHVPVGGDEAFGREHESAAHS